MKPLSRFQLDHHNYQGARLHNDLNKTVQQTNENFLSHQAMIDANVANIGTLQTQLASALARITALEASQNAS